MDHLERTRHEFTRQAAQFASSAAITDDELTRRFSEAVGPSGTVLDVACGPGIVTVALAATAREVVAFDLTPEMLGKARERCRKAGLTNVTFREGDATALPFAEDFFDAVVTRLSIHHFTEPHRVLAEMFRVLKRGGACVVADIISSDSREDSALHNALEIWRDPSHTRMLPRAELIALIEAAGFAIEAQTTWDQTRGLDEWLSIVDDPARVGPLRRVMRALATAGESAGMELMRSDGDVSFVHRWHLIAARKP